ncbi:unnamed protein product [Adineta steineri]|uniref:Uncharacterized protein n=1 Tax=Adineta steineri TaxID=433720 RepID=A0A819SU55_9BILA|nr:unnamed protein product [Adineta steineri]CAF3896778.1 unnamed protein product [Adineta steineri]CAF4065499.1 unnamed protein product [Adineta steineri]
MFAGLHAAARTDVLYAVFKDQFVFSLGIIGQAVAQHLNIIEKGSLRIAQTSGRLHTFKRQYYTTTALGIDCEILSHEKLREKVPIVDP